MLNSQNAHTPSGGSNTKIRVLPKFSYQNRHTQICCARVCGCVCLLPRIYVSLVSPYNVSCIPIGQLNVFCSNCIYICMYILVYSRLKDADHCAVSCSFIWSCVCFVIVKSVHKREFGTRSCVILPRLKQNEWSFCALICTYIHMCVYNTSNCLTCIGVCVCVCVFAALECLWNTYIHMSTPSANLLSMLLDIC